MKAPKITKDKPDHRFQKLTQFVAERSSPQSQFHKKVDPEKEAEEIVKKRNKLEKHEGVPLYENQS